MSNLLAKVALRIWALDAARQKAGAAMAEQENSPLGMSFGAAMRRKQNANLISHIYELSGNGTLPVSGGKFELKKRGKLFQDF